MIAGTTSLLKIVSASRQKLRRDRRERDEDNDYDDDDNIERKEENGE